MNNKTDARLFILNGGIQRKIHDKVKHRDVKKSSEYLLNHQHQRKV